MKKNNGITAALIAPCGMNCCLCIAYVRDRDPCPGCRRDDRVKPITRYTCRIKTCRKLIRNNAKYCFKCDEFPCDRLTHLDKRYRTKYAMSMLDNLASISALGIRRFLAAEKEKWSCPACGQLLCVHKPQCLSCGRPRR
ncbi:MAG: DUF3795 domain-containing protein [Sedimentisphaerales bacterium]|nr:DUF3795 domain-containing protein [Sedimentisphaerales bacterium]